MASHSYSRKVEQQLLSVLEWRCSSVRLCQSLFKRAVGGVNQAVERRIYLPSSGTPCHGLNQDTIGWGMWVGAHASPMQPGDQIQYGDAPQVRAPQVYRFGPTLLLDLHFANAQNEPRT